MKELGLSLLIAVFSGALVWANEGPAFAIWGVGIIVFWTILCSPRWDNGRR